MTLPLSIPKHDSSPLQAMHLKAGKSYCCKNKGNSDIQNIAVINHRVMRLKDADRMSNSVDPDQTVSLGAV